MSDSAPILLTAGPRDSGVRLDVVLQRALQRALPGTTRSRLQQWIKAGRVTLDGAPARASTEVKQGQSIAVHPAAATPLRAFAEDIPLDILYEDPHLVAVNKPAGMVVHLGAGREEGTLVNALLHRYGALSGGSQAERPGIVHRIDKDTSGVLLVARTDAAHQALAAQFATRRIGKVYLALVEGHLPTGSGRIEKPIERDPRHRTRMTARTGQGRAAITEYKALQRLQSADKKFTLLEVRILTGRTHQIRAHFSALGHPIAGDQLYGAQPAPSIPALNGRFFLHAHRIEFLHPATATPQSLEAPLPPELAAWRNSLTPS